MKTGIIRRIDDLGRIVIPTEIRKQLKIKAGDPFELEIKEGSIVFSKYQEINDYNHRIQILKIFFGENNVHLYFNDADIPTSEENVFLVDSYVWITVSSEQFSNDFIRTKVKELLETISN